MTSLDAVTAATADVRVGGARTGSAVLVGERHLLTAEHVVRTAVGTKTIRVTFPGRTDGLDAHRVALDGRGDMDVAVLELGEPAPAEPLALPSGRRLPATVQVFGFPVGEQKPTGVWRTYAVSSTTTAGTVQLDWTTAGALRGQSGGPVVDGDGRVHGILVEGTDGAAFDRFLPVSSIETVWHGLRRPWSYAGQDARAHFDARADGRLGVAGTADVFRGRAVSLAAIRDWLASETPPGRVLAVVGHPGAGKSAVLARGARAAERGARATGGLVFHAHEATDASFADALGEVLGLDRGLTLDDTLHRLALGLLDRPVARFAVMVDALDEAASPTDRRAIATALRELATLPWLRVVVATRPVAGGGYATSALLKTLVGSGAGPGEVLDLDRPPYRDEDALTGFAAAVLAQEGVATPTPPEGAWREYRSRPAVRDRLAAAITGQADGNFLVAKLTAGELARRPAVVDPLAPGSDLERLPTTVADVLETYVAGLPEKRGVVALRLLQALAHARGSGLDDRLWLRFAQTGEYPVTAVDLDRLRAGAAADFLLTTTEDGVRVCRLFHQALVDDLRRDNPLDDGSVYASLLDHVTAAGGWAAVPYARRYGVEHAVEAERLAELLRDPAFLVAAEPRRLGAAVRRSPWTSTRTTVLRALEALQDEELGERASHLALAAMIEADPDLQQADLSGQAWTPRWVAWTDRITGELVTTTPGAVTGIALRRDPGRTVAVVTGEAGLVRAVDAGDGTELWSAQVAAGVVRAAASADGALVAVSLADGTLAVLDGGDGARLWTGPHPEPAPNALAVGVVDGRVRVATGTYNEGLDDLDDAPVPGPGHPRRPLMGVVRLWDADRQAPGGPRWTRACFGAGVQSLHVLPGRHAVLASGDPFGERDGMIARVLSVASGADVAPGLPGQPGDVRGVAAAGADDAVVATADRVVRWHLDTGAQRTGPAPITPGPPDDVSLISDGGREFLVMEAYRDVVVVDARDLRRVNRAHAVHEPISAMAALGSDDGSGAALLVTGSLEGEVRVWPVAPFMAPGETRLARVIDGAVHPATGTAAVVVDDPPAALELRDVHDGRLIDRFEQVPSAVVADAGRDLLLLGYRDGRIDAHRLPGLEREWSRRVHDDQVRTIRVHGDVVLSTGDDHALRLSRAGDGSPLRPPVRENGWEDKGMDELEVVARTGGASATVVAGGFVFGLAAWDLDDLLRPDQPGPGPRIDWGRTVRTSSSATLLGTLHLGGEDLLASADTFDGAVQLLSPTAAPARTWAAHEHRVTAVAQAGGRIWTGDSWGNVRIWAAPVRGAADFPRLESEIRLRTTVTTLLPVDAGTALIGTESGLLAVDHPRVPAGR